jgi:capsular exopolysaccharide synthesis family protein
MATLSNLLLNPVALQQHTANGKDGASEHPNAGPVPHGFQDVQVPRIDPSSRMVLFTDPGSPGADRFRFLRMRLKELRSVANVRSILITSPLPEDGKSTITLNLAIALAESGQKRVLVVEGDLRHPSIAARLGVPVQPGLAECLETGRDPLALICRLRPLDWFLLQAGRASNNPTELLHYSSLSETLKNLSTQFDWVLIDTPPVTPLTDAVILSKEADASLLVVRAGQTPKEPTEQALQLLGPNKVFGIIFNAVDGLNRIYSKYHRYYGKKLS